MNLNASFVEFEYSKDWTEASRDWFHSRLNIFIAWCISQGVTEIENITAPLVRRFIEYRRATKNLYGNPLSSQTLHGDVRAIKDWLNWAVREDLPDEKVVRHIDLPKRDQKIIPIFTPKQIDLLFLACEQSQTPAREKAILALLIDTGIRTNELCTLTLDRVYFTDAEAWILVNGKNRKQREVGLGKRARTLLHRYIHRHRKGWLLYRLRDRAGAEHFQGVRVSVHTFRHHYAVSYLQNGGDIYRLSRLLGHSPVSTTEGYLKQFTARDARQGSESVLDQHKKR